jgi:hypothetical protein
MNTQTDTEATTGNPTPNLPSLIRLPRAYPPSRVMADPDQLRMKVVDYFSMLTADLEDRRHPTPPGLAMALGLRSFDALLHILQVAEEDPSTYPEESLDVLHVARTHIEDYYINNGLRETIPHAFLKFLLSAYFNRSEKTIQETLNARDNQLNINILGISAPLPVIEATNGPTIDVEHHEATEGFTIVYDTPTSITDDLEDL